MLTNQDIYQHVLWHPIWGDIWDLDNDEPLTHPNCKCYLEVTYEATLEELLFPSEVTTFNRTGKTVTTARSTTTGQFTQTNPFQEFGIMTSNIKEMKEEITSFERDLAKAQNRIENTKYQLLTYLQLLQKSGLPPEIDKAITILVRAKMTAEQAQRALYLLMAASGPTGWAMALASIGITAISAAGTANAAMEVGGT